MNDESILRSHWCRVPESRSEEWEYLLFRRTLTCVGETPFEMAVSADSRYNLFLDDVLLGRGPCRGDLQHYHYETYSGMLTPGFHIFAVEVTVFRNGFSGGVWSEVHCGGGFFAAGTAGEAELSTPGNWLCLPDRSRRHRLWREAWDSQTVIPAPPVEEVDFSCAEHGWKTANCDDSHWKRPEDIGGCCLKDKCGTDPAVPWQLAPREIPLMRETPAPVAAVIFDAGTACRITDGRFHGVVPAGKHTILLDMGCYRTAIYHLRTTGGSGTLRLAVAEKLAVAGGFSRKPVPEGRIGASGYADLCRLTPERCEFDTFWYRSGRFVELEFSLAEAVEAELYADAIHYPFDLKTEFSCRGFDELEPVFRISWNTALACAHEHYEDCPYYEQLQYAGDTRIQALISYALTGDGRLGRQAIRQFDRSRMAHGLTQSRYPCNRPQFIPIFSLYWILMVEDYYNYFGDRRVITEHWNGIVNVLDYFEEKRQSSGLIGPAGYWTFSDWCEGWPSGRSSRGLDEPETLTNLVYAECCRVAAKFAETSRAEEFRERRRKTLDAVNRFCYDARERCYTDLPGYAYYSEHVNIWALLTDAASSERSDSVMQGLLSENRWTRCTLFFSFYLFELLRRKRKTAAMEKLLQRWHDLLPYGFTTFPETPDAERTRSDCHAWSASPAYEIVRSCFGVSPLEPGFARVLIEPLPGKIQSFDGTVPAGRGRLLKVHWRNDQDGLTLRLTADADLETLVILPDGSRHEVELLPGKAEMLHAKKSHLYDPQMYQEERTP